MARAEAARPSWFLFRRHVAVLPYEESTQENAAMARASLEPASYSVVRDFDRSEFLRAVTLDAHLADPPELSTLSLRVKPRKPPCELDEDDYYVSVVVVKLLTHDHYDLWDYYLVYDAAKNSLVFLHGVFVCTTKLIPQCMPVILPPRGDGGEHYALADFTDDLSPQLLRI